MADPIAFLAAGRNDTRVFGLSPAERARRFAAKAGLVPVDAPPAAGALVVADLGHAWDPAWLAHVVATPGLAVTIGGRPALVHIIDARDAPALLDAIARGDALPWACAEQRVEDGATLYHHGLRKREAAYLMPLTPETAATVERASYDGAYKGVTDLLTLHLWRGLAFHLTRLAASLRLSPNLVSLAGLALCVATFFLWMRGHYWPGIATGFVFMVLDTVDGKLARCTGTSSEWGNLLDHGIDLVHPPFWYWAWGTGLVAVGHAMAPERLWAIMAVLIAGYAVQRAAEGAFITAFGIHIHVWERIDSRFRLVTARRNPNMVILVAGALARREDVGLVAVAWWTVLSCIFHVVRLVQARRRRARGGTVASWLA